MNKDFAYMEMMNKQLKYTYYPDSCVGEYKKYGLETYVYIDSSYQHACLCVRLYGRWKITEV